MELIGLFLALATLIFLSWKGFDPVPATLIAAIVLAVTNGISLADAIVVNYVKGIAAFLPMGFLLMVTGALFGKVMSECRATTAIAYKLMELVGKQRSILIIMLSTGVLTYVGINPLILIFSLYPIIITLCTASNTPLRLGLAAMMAGSFFPLNLPGTADSNNVIMAEGLGLPITAGALWGILCSMLMFFLSYGYLIWQEARAKKKGENFVERHGSFGPVRTDWENLPPVGKALIPIIILMLIIFVGGRFFSPTVSVVSALICSTVVAVLLFWKDLPNKAKLVNQGIASSFSVVFSIGSLLGFASMIQELPVFHRIIAGILTWDINPLLLMVIVLAVITMITSSSVGAIALFVNTLLEHFVELGVPPILAYRMGIMGALSTSAMPQDGGINAGYAVAGTNHKECYKDICVVGMVVPTISTIIPLIIAFVAGWA